MIKKIALFILATALAYPLLNTVFVLNNKTVMLENQLKEVVIQNAELQGNMDFLEEQLDEKVVELSKTIESQNIVNNFSRSGSEIGQELQPITDELIEFYRVVSLEAITEDYEGCLAVATVVMNRLESKNFQNSIFEILSAPGQFTTWDNKTYNRINNIVKRATNDAIAGKKNLPNDCLYFYATYAYREGRGKIFVAEIGDNTFFKYD